MSDFNTLCENFGVIKTTKRILYPKQIKLSEEFIQALKMEYFRQKLDEEVSSPVKNRPEKFLKALKFHISHMENNSVEELLKFKKMMTEKKRGKVKSVFSFDKIIGKNDIVQKINTKKEK